MSRVALVTGASKGIGAATALRLAADGYDVCVNYLRDSEAARQVADAVAIHGGRAITVQADVSVEEEVVGLFKSLDEQLGRLDVLVNNAGILFPQARLVDMDAERLQRVLVANVSSCFLCSREAILRMSTDRGGNGGAIVNVSSMAARLGSAGEYIDYAASKGAVDTLTVGLAREVAAEGIRVNAVRPGLIHTGIHAAGGEPGRVDRLAPSTPLGRGGQPEEVAAAIAWLLSDESSYTTGSFIDIAGGR